MGRPVVGGGGAGDSRGELAWYVDPTWSEWVEGPT